MQLSAPLYRLRRTAKALAREQQIPLHQALDRIAAAEGFEHWSLLVAKAAEESASATVLAALDPGDLMLMGARPGHGKTMMSLELAIEAMKSGRQGVFFSLEYTEADILDLFRAIGENPIVFEDRFEFDASDAINADYMIGRLGDAPQGTVVVIDYLQLLDQRRNDPDLMTQIRSLRAFANLKGLILIFIAQIDRAYERSTRSCPDLEDVRLPNPLELGLFDKACFLNDGEIRFTATG